MNSLIHLVFLLGWSVLGFEVMRSLIQLWTKNKSTALLSAIVAVGAFLLGSTSHFAWSLPLRADPAQPIAAVATPSIAPQSPGVRVDCPRDASVVGRAAIGYVDSIAVNGGSLIMQPRSFTASRHDSFRLQGWGATTGGPGRAVCLLIDGRVAKSTAFYGLSRPDVAAATKVAADADAGFALVDTLPPGAYVVTVGVLLEDGHSIQTFGEPIRALIR